MEAALIYNDHDCSEDYLEKQNVTYFYDGIQITSKYNNVLFALTNTIYHKIYNIKQKRFNLCECVSDVEMY